MRSRLRACALVFALTTALVVTLTAGPAYAKQPDPNGRDSFEVYEGTLTPEQLNELRSVGVDAREITRETDGSATKVETVLTERQAARLAAKGVKLEVKRIGGKAASQVLREQAAAGFDVYRSYSEPGGIKDEINAVAAQYPMLTKVVTIGKSVQGKDIRAVKVTRNAKQVADGSRPATAYTGAQHAREWITVEMTRRLLHHLLDNYGKDAAITTLVNRTELWFIPVANPDGYDYTFTDDNRLWRKNLADNDDDGQITAGDGVDPNRNFAYKWGWDNEGSSPDPFSETFRGPGANSEPETRALDDLFRRIGFEFYINYHSAAELLLYGVGWQVSTPTPDDEIYKAMAGDDADPAVPGYDPDISAELYTTNGDTDTHMTVRYGTLGFTPEMTTCQTVSDSIPDDEWESEDCASGFNFPDDEDLIQAEFVKNIPFALAVARSALDPDDPISVVGESTPDFVIDDFEVSYGTRQPVATIARRALSDVQMHYSINGGGTHSVGVDEWQGGERYGDTHDDYYAELRGTVTGTEAGDEVEVWFSGRKQGAGQITSEHFTYNVHDDIGGEVLILAVEDVTGLSPVQTGTSAKYADEMAAALSAADRTSDVYDFDTQGRKAPHHLGVLSHYEAVLWETGDDVILRAPGQVPGTTMKAALDIELSVRDYLNEGGKALVSGKNALFAQAANGAYFYNPNVPAESECDDPDDLVCLPVLNDFQQYWLGAYNYISGGGTADDGSTYPLAGIADPYAGWDATLDASQNHTASFLPRSSFLPPAEFPWFGPSSAPVDWARPGAAPFEPHTGDWHLFSGQADVSYKRLTRSVDLTGASSGELRFFTSYETELDWDYLFVEAHEVGTDTWTTLPDANGHTGTDTGQSCPAGWHELHPFLAHYQGEDCSPTGTTGGWNAATGSSAGSEEWVIDLAEYAGKQVELSISYVSDWATQGIGVFLDDVSVTVDGAVAAETSFETDLGGWTVAEPPEGSAPNLNSWARSQLAYEEGAVTITTDTVYTGFGLEGLSAEERAEFVTRSMQHLLGGASPALDLAANPRNRR
jgi:Zinc carboxypeptidase/Immune inhibitor A peptidase M6